MPPDPWGIDTAYNDGRWGPPSAQTHQTLLAAMGAGDAQPPPPGPEPVRVLRQPTAVPWDRPGQLHLEDGAVIAVQGHLPADLPLGYHQFHAAGGPAETWVIVAPSSCVPPAGRAWGCAVQLYAARSEQSWGMGDLGDLRRLAQGLAALGAGFVMLNPLLADAPVLPQEPSPYYPSSRLFGNALYLRVEEVPGAGSSEGCWSRWPRRAGRCATTA